MWIIKDQLGRFWQKGIGWIEDRTGATQFTDTHTKIFPLPVNGQWFFEPHTANAA